MSTDANGAFDTAFGVPLGTPYGSSYTLFAGDHVGRYFPAATYEAFEITAPAASGFFDADETHTAAVVVAGQTTVDFGFPEGTGGTWTATITNAGPEPEGFSLAGDPYIYYNLETTAVLSGAEVEVCITYDTANIPIPPRLFHHERVVDGRFRWVDITDPDASTPGRVCGTTTSFLLHFNRQGQRYKLRDFTHVDAGGKVRPFHAPDPSSKRLITGTDEFIAAYAPAMVKNVRDEQLPMAQVARWQDVFARAADVRR